MLTRLSALRASDNTVTLVMNDWQGDFQALLPCPKQALQ
jgi:hypothetical protein